MQRAVEVAMATGVAYIRTNPHPTSEKTRALIESTLRELGCESPEGVIVVGGKEGANPHAIGHGALLPEQPIVIDIFPRSKKTKYFADMSRTVCLGTPSLELKKMYDAVREAQELAFRMLGPGVEGADIQQAVEHFFEKKGFKRKGIYPGKDKWLAREGFIHSVGHGVGKEIHEPPFLSARGGTLKEGVVVTVEPGLYYPNIGGIRIEDMVLITKDGYKNLTRFSKEFVL